MDVHNDVFKKLCRICRTSYTIKCNVFETFIDQISLHHMYNFVTDLAIAEDDSKVSNMMCKKCIERLKDAYDIKNQAINSYKYFKDLNDVSPSNTILIKSNDDNLKNQNIYSIVAIETNENKKIEQKPTKPYKLWNFENKSSELKSPILELTDLAVESENEKNQSTDTAEPLDGVQLILKEFEKYSKKCDENPYEDTRKNFLCVICQMRFSRKSNLVDHLRLHADVKPFHCAYCSKSFVQIANLRTHERTHTKEKPFKCHICPKSYTQSSSLKIHIRSHTNERNYHCNVCSKSFTNSSDLLKHRRVHDPSEQIKCDFCSKLFAQKVNLNIHIKKNHSNKN